MKKQIIVTMLLAAALGTVSPSMKAGSKVEGRCKRPLVYHQGCTGLRCWLEADR